MTIPPDLSRRAFLAWLVAVAPLTFQACASGGRSDAAAPRGARNLITFEELDGQPPGDLLLIVRRLRPEWFRATTGPARGPRGRQETETPAVHVDGRLAGNSEVLTALEVTDVQEIRFRSAADASVLYDYPVGLIEVTTRR